MKLTKLKTVAQIMASDLTPTEMLQTLRARLAFLAPQDWRESVRDEMTEVEEAINVIEG